MTTRAFLDELMKLGSAGPFHLGELLFGDRAPMNSVGVLVREAMHKRASLADLHDEVAPEAINLVPQDASSRVEPSSTPSKIVAGALGGVTTSKEPIDRDRFNRVWNQPPRNS